MLGRLDANHEENHTEQAGRSVSDSPEGVFRPGSADQPAGGAGSRSGSGPSGLEIPDWANVNDQALEILLGSL